ncbi:MAG: exopolysaccharide biosynthesis polyprenyl glycosylphosphotransferase [Ruminococcus sp.]|nr:exopolysaccharide biosynthesis polyprenyl glycosylphosphotransferase [Ruminococcus sp.]
MNKGKYLKEKIILYFFKILISGLFAGGMTYCWVAYFNPYVPTPFYRYGNYFLAVVFLAVYVWFVKVYGGFLVGTSPVSDLVFSQIIAIAFLQAVSYVIFSLLSYRLVSVVPFLIMFVVFSVFATIWAFAVDFIYYKLHAPKKTIVVFNNVDSYLSLKGIRSMDRRFRVVRTVNSEKTSLDELFDYMRSVDAVFLCGVPSDYRNEVVKHCIAVGKVAYIKPKISDTIIRGGRTIQLMNVPVYRCKRSDNSLAYQFGKRAADIIISAIGIVVLSPIMLITALAIKLEDHGPVFYKQTRLTLNGKQFKIIKFRSMRVDAEKDGVARLAEDNDDRITKVGRIIRKCRIDEIPQIFNILGGSMSIVGPRPERPEIAKEYEASMPEFALRLQVKAGLTGYAQIYGKYNTPPYDKVQMDLMYVANQSFIEDFKLILMTLKIMFVPSSTEGISKDQRTALRKDKNEEEQ